jgi:uncharacterized membrane protein HdeD (DUF308 family)
LKIPNYARDRLTLQRCAHGTQKKRKRWQQLVGLCCCWPGYACLAVPAETASEWLLLRVVGGFVLLVCGLFRGHWPHGDRLLGDHD